MSTQLTAVVSGKSENTLGGNIDGTTTVSYMVRFEIKDPSNNLRPMPLGQFAVTVDKDTFDGYTIGQSVSLVLG